MSDTQKWSLLLVGDNSGLVAQSGNDWKGSPEHFEQVEVVRADLYDKQAERIAKLEAENAKLTGTAHPGYIVGQHWLIAAYDRICAGDDETQVLQDFGLRRTPTGE